MVEGANLIGRFHSWRHGIATFINFFIGWSAESKWYAIFNQKRTSKKIPFCILLFWNVILFRTFSTLGTKQDFTQGEGKCCPFESQLQILGADVMIKQCVVILRTSGFTSHSLLQQTFLVDLILLTSDWCFYASWSGWFHRFFVVEMYKIWK